MINVSFAAKTSCQIIAHDLLFVCSRGCTWAESAVNDLSPALFPVNETVRCALSPSLVPDHGLHDHDHDLLDLSHEFPVHHGRALSKILQFSVFLVLLVVSHGLPVEDQAPLVVDIPASASREEIQKPLRVEQVPTDDSSVEILPIASQSSSDEEFDSGSRVHSIFDLFNLNRPQTPLFVFRRPAIRDPFEEREVIRPTQNVFVREPTAPNTYDFMRHMDLMMRQVQQQLNSFMGFAHSHFQPPRPHNSFPRPIFPSFFDHRDQNETESGEVIQLDNLPGNYSNTTSEIKEIDGQEVQINKTIKRVSSGNGSSFFQVSVINYRPKTTGKPAVEPTPASSEVVTHQPEIHAEAPETSTKAEDPMMNEIDQLDDKQRPQQTNPVVSESDFPFLLNRFRGQYEVEKGNINKPAEELKQEPLEPTVEVVPLPEQRRSQRMAYGGGADLSGDIRINKIMAEQQKQAQIRMVHPDVELLDV